MAKLSETAARLIAIIGEETAVKINRSYPFIVERNALSQELFRRGVQRKILIEVSDISKSSIYRICRLQDGHGEGEGGHDVLYR